jgi:hypothetical protein
MHNKPKRGNSTSIKREGMKHMLCFLMLYKYLVRIYMIKNGEEKLVYNPKGIALIKRKKLDYLFKKSGKEAYLNDEVTIQ